MMDFSVNFMQRATVVIKEALKLKKYKSMHLALAIVVGILMLPVVVACIGCAAFLFVLGYLFSVISLPAQRLHKLLHDEGQSVQHATQFILYFLSWAFIFSTYTLLSFFLIVLTVLYSVFSILTYIWTLGGIKFHVFANDEDVSVDVDGKYPILIPIIFMAGMAVLLFLVPMIKTIGVVIDYAEFMEITFKFFVNTFKAQFRAISDWRFLFSAVYSVLVFAPFPKKKAEQ